MKRLFTTIASAILLILGANAQPSSVKNITKSMFTLKAFDKNGNTIASTNGIFTSANGEGVCTWKPVANAARAELTDCNGRKYEVNTIIGANELYDVCKIKAATQGKTVPAAVATTTQPDGQRYGCSPVQTRKFRASNTKCSAQRLSWTNTPTTY